MGDRMPDAGVARARARDTAPDESTDVVVVGGGGSGLAAAIEARAAGARVVVLEKTNARYLTRAEVPDPIALLVCDASFIGLETILPAPLALTAQNATLVALIKPQFEVGRGQVGKGGVVRDPALHAQVCERIAGWLAAQAGWSVLGVTPSPITGPHGNVEFLIAARHTG